MTVGPHGRIVRDELPLEEFEMSATPDRMPEMPQGTVLVSGQVHYGVTGRDDGVEDLKACLHIGDIWREVLRRELFGTNELNWYVLDIASAISVGLVEPETELKAKAL